VPLLRDVAGSLRRPDADEQIAETAPLPGRAGPRGPAGDAVAGAGRKAFERYLVWRTRVAGQAVARACAMPGPRRLARGILTRDSEGRRLRRCLRRRRPLWRRRPTCRAVAGSDCARQAAAFSLSASGPRRRRREAGDGAPVLRPGPGAAGNGAGRAAVGVPR
jgi:hypothetical protein